nr:SsrA-binding protein [Helicobacter pylori]
MGLPDVGGEFGSCSVCLMDFTELELQRIRSIISYKGVTLRASYAKYKCMGVLYCKLAAFTPNTKDV